MYVCVCVTSSRWRCGGHEVAGEDSTFGGIHAKVAHFLQMEGAVRVEACAEPAIQLPIGDGCRFCRVPSRPAILSPRWTSTLPYHHTPGVPRAGSWTGPPLQYLMATMAGRPGAPRRPVLQPWRQAAAHPGAFRRGPGQPTLITTKQDPGYCLGPALRPLWAR